MLGIVGTHKGKLQQVFHAALCVGAAVHQHRAAIARGDHRGQRRAADAPDALNQQCGGGQDRTGGAGTDKGVPFPVLELIEPHGQGGVLLLPERVGRVVTDLHHLAGVGDLHTVRQLVDAVVMQHGQNLLTAPHQRDVHAVLLVGLDRAQHRGFGGVVAAHGVYDDSHAGSLLSLFGHDLCQRVQRALG